MTAMNPSVQVITVTAFLSIHCNIPGGRNELCSAGLDAD